MKNKINRILLTSLFTGLFLLQSSCAIFAAEGDVLTYSPSLDGFIQAPKSANMANAQIHIGYAPNDEGNRDDNNAANRIAVMKFDTRKATEEPVRPYDFEDGTAQGFVPNKNAAVSVADGVLTLKDYTATDVRLETPDNLGIDASTCQTIVVRMKNNTNVRTLVLFFATTAANYNGNQRLELPISSMDEDFTEYRFNVGDNANWKGTIKRLRFDCATSYAATEGAANTMEFDSITFAAKKMSLDPDIDFANNDYKVELKYHAINHSSNTVNNTLIYGVSGDAKDQVNGSMNWSNSGNVISYTDNLLFDNKIRSNAWNVVDVTDYVKSQTDGVYAFKFDMADTGTSYAIFCDSSESANPPELVFTKTAENKAYTFLLSGVTSSGNETLASGADITKVSIVKNKEYAGNAVMIFAVYDKETDVLLDVYTKEIAEAATAEVGATIDIATSFKLPEHGNMKANVHFWDSLSDLKPLSRTQAVQ